MDKEWSGFSIFQDLEELKGCFLSFLSRIKPVTQSNRLAAFKSRFLCYLNFFHVV